MTGVPHLLSLPHTLHPYRLQYCVLPTDTHGKAESRENGTGDDTPPPHTHNTRLCDAVRSIMTWRRRAAVGVAP